LKIPAMVIAGTHSGCGKTTVTLGIMAALRQRSFRVQGFKVGPDFIDPGHHRRITGRPSHNLDGWMLDHGVNRRIFNRYAADADIAVVEGVMGLFDGFSGRDESGSTAQMAKRLGLPVILVIDARSMARSAGAVALGFSTFDPELVLGGVLFNRVGSPGHGHILEEALSSGVAVSLLGCLPVQQDLEIPSRHLGLMTDEDFTSDEDAGGRLASWIENSVDLDRLLSSLRTVDVPDAVQDAQVKRPGDPGGRVRIGVARDEAFCFYYPENLRLLEEAGAELVFFSPLRSDRLPRGIQGLILGGGYPELHCEALCRKRGLLEEVRDFALGGGPVYGECGGFMVLMEELTDLAGRSFPMAGVFPLRARMEKRLCALGYREVETLEESPLGPAGTLVRGHEFHYSRIVGEEGAEGKEKKSMTTKSTKEHEGHEEREKSVRCIYSVSSRRGGGAAVEGYVRERTLGSYIHLHWGSNLEVPARFVRACRQWGNKKRLKSMTTKEKKKALISQYSNLKSQSRSKITEK